MATATILIVEDEFIVAKDLQIHLEHLGYRVGGRVNSGEKAIQYIQETDIDLVLMDIMLKGAMDGIETAAQIRSRFHIPVIYLTANTNPQIFAQAKITEPFGFIVKPFSERDLQANIEMALYKHRMEERLRESEQKYRQVVENANEIITVIQNGRIMLVNPVATAITGYSREELLNTSFIEFIHPEDRDLVMDRYRRRQQGQQVPESYPVRGVHKTGAIRWLEVRAMLIEWEDRPATLIFLNDITEQKQAEEELTRYKNHLEELVKQRTIALQQEITEHKQTERELRESQHRFQELTELLPQSVFEIDLQGHFLYANRWGFESTGYTPEDLERGFDVFQLIIPEEHERLKHNIIRILNGAAVEPHEYTMVRKDGTTYPALVYSAPIIRNQQPVGLRGIGIDLTERKRLEAQLIQSQKMEAVGQLAGGVAHDFNTLLGIILGHGEMMRDDLPEESPIWENLQEIIAAGSRAKAVVRQLLDFARPNERDRRPIRLASIVEESSRLLRSLLPKTITIRHHNEVESNLVLANSTQIAQIIMNLGMNARDAIGGQKGTIEIALENVDVHAEMADLQGVRQGAYIQLSISDTGCGMSHDILEHIFEPFFTTKEVGKGSGLGLAVVHGIVTSHGGFITVESTPGKGTRFLIYLPGIEKLTFDI